MAGTPRPPDSFLQPEHRVGYGTVLKGAAPRSSGNGGFDLGGWAIGELLGMYGDNGQYSPGGGGGFVSRAGERAAAQAAYNQAEADRSKVYGQAVGAVKERNPQIRAGYDQGTAEIQANARARAIADRAASMQREQQSADAADAYGLNVNPGANARANEVAEENIGQYQTNADSWQGFNAGAGERAIERNNAVGDAFTWQGAQQQQQLAALLQAALAGMQDYSYGGSAGGWVGGTSQKDKLGIAKELLGFSDKDFDNDLNASKFVASRSRSGDF